MNRRFGRSGIISWVFAVFAAIFSLVATPLLAHEPSLAVLELRELGPVGHYLGEWPLPPTDPNLKPIFPAQCTWAPPELSCGEKGLIGRLSFEGLGVNQSATMIRIFQGRTVANLYGQRRASGRQSRP